MSHMTWREKRYRRAHLSCARHITLDPEGAGRRAHPHDPAADGKPRRDPFLLLLNGAQLVPLNAVAGPCCWRTSWIGSSRSPAARSARRTGPAMVRGAVDETHRTYPRTDRALLQEDLELMLRSLVAIAQGQRAGRGRRRR